ncbi:MAG: class I SAM-dependent methyltransferase [Chloroflexi bacterium]|nr:class I SAM-dependent methyltransferase [Chloroflexota bacterium]
MESLERFIIKKDNNMKFASRPCPVCNHHQADVLHTQRFELPEDHPLSNGYDVVVCLQCGFIYADTSVTQADYDRFYAKYSKYEDSKTGTGGVENPYDWRRQQETAHQIANFLQNPNASILDVGCANGGILKALQELGYRNLCGIDPSLTCVENTRRLGIEAHQGSLFQPFKEHVFDCIILSHTLEHVQDVQGAINWIENNLKSDGVIYLETPDATRYVDFLYAPLQDFNTEHINHFSLKCLTNLMGEYDFALINGGSKTLAIGSELFYPAIYGFWKQNGANEYNLTKDENLRNEVEKYIQRSAEILKRIDIHLQKALARSPKIIVWGTGQLAMKLLIETSLAHANILAFIDNNPINRGRTLKHIPVIGPDQLQDSVTPIVITTMLHHQAIAEQIKQMGLKNEIIFLAE